MPGRADTLPAPAAQRLSRGARLGFVALFVATVVIMMGLPQLLRTIPVRPSIPVADLRGQVSGAYVTSENHGLFKLYPYPLKVEAFPAGAATLAAGGVIYVRARQLDDLSMYTVASYPSGATVPTSVRRVDELTLENAPLSPGRYYVKVSKDSVNAGFDYGYFRVADGPGPGGGLCEA